MKLEELPPQLRGAATSMHKLGADAYAAARKKFVDALANHTGDVDQAKQTADGCWDRRVPPPPAFSTAHPQINAAP